MTKKNPRLATRARDENDYPILSNAEVAVIACAAYKIGKKRGLNVLQQLQAWTGEVLL